MGTTKHGNIKTWFEENENKIMKGAFCAIGFGLGYFIGMKVSDRKFGIGLLSLHDLGFIKCFNPTNGLEIDVGEVSAVIESFYKK